MVDSNNKKRIEVHDASILRSNEHPKFKIGDVINNGCVYFIVKGFTRSFMGLAYVLDNGRKLICWLTEQAEAKCNLVYNNDIKETPPKKIYLLPRQGGDYAPYWKTDSQDRFGIEYARIDTVIEKSIKFFDEDIWKYIDVENANCDTFINIDRDKLKEDFKKYIEK